MPFSVNSLLSESQITLEKTASDSFGNVVQDFVRGGMGGFIPAANPNAPANRNDGSWYSTSYAAALAGGTSYRPKLKFLFKVEFIFTEKAKQELNGFLGRATANDFTFMIKSVDRPKIDFEYEEDVNMYNFRTKVLKKIRHRDLTVVFMDDAGNRVFDFFRALMMIHSPITRRQMERDNTLTKPSSTSIGVGSGMAFNNTSRDNAHRSVVNSNYGNSIEAIRVKQIFVDSSAPLSSASKMVTFDFLNPRIISFDMDELTHEASDPSLLTMIFDYDWMEMVNVGSLGTAQAAYTPDYNITAPGVHGAPSDITPNTTNGAVSSAQGQNSGLSGALSSIIGRGSSNLTSDLISRGVKTVAGNGRFASELGGIASSAVAGPIGGIVQGASRDALGGLFSSVNNPQARPSASLITDSTSAGRDRPVAAVFSSSAYFLQNPAPRGDT